MNANPPSAATISDFRAKFSADRPAGELGNLGDIGTLAIANGRFHDRKLLVRDARIHPVVFHPGLTKDAALRAWGFERTSPWWRVDETTVEADVRVIPDRTVDAAFVLGLPKNWRDYLEVSR